MREKPAIAPRYRSLNEAKSVTLSRVCGAVLVLVEEFDRSTRAAVKTSSSSVPLLLPPVPLALIYSQPPSLLLPSVYLCFQHGLRPGMLVGCGKEV